MSSNSLSVIGLDQSLWNLYRTDNPYLHTGILEVPYMKRDCFKTVFNDRKATLGVYEWKGEEVFQAWGYADEEHCSYHAVKVNGVWSDTIASCPDINFITTDNKVTGFTLKHKSKLFRWGEHGYSEEEVDESENSPTSNICLVSGIPNDSLTFGESVALYRPLITVTGLSFTLGGLVTFFGSQTSYDFLMYSMGFFILMIGLLKLIDVRSFATMFAQYDPIAKHVPLYATIYPYLEVVIGMIVLSGTLMLFTNTLVVMIYGITTFGIVMSLRKNQKLECGCLGKSFKLPLSGVTIVENTVMILMALYMIMLHVGW